MTDFLTTFFHEVFSVVRVDERTARTSDLDVISFNSIF